MPIKGIDVSHWQGNVDFSRVYNAGYDFVMLKATQGLTYLDTMFNANYRAAKASQLHVGCYHYGTFGTVAQAKAEANFLLSKIKGLTLTYPVVIDLEENKSGASRSQLTDALIAFLETLEGAGYFAMYYTGKYFLDAYLDANRLKPYASWIARYNAPNAGVDCGIWQYTQEGSVPGVQGHCDVNLAYQNFNYTSPRVAPIQTAKISTAHITSPTSKAVPVQHVYHTVVSGDTLSELALKNNTTVSAIKSLNHLTSDVIYIGQRLIIK